VRRVESAGASQIRFPVSPSVEGGGEEGQEGASAANQLVPAIYKKGTGLVSLLACSLALYSFCACGSIKKFGCVCRGVTTGRNKISDR
jgi:hypothetical protein